SDRRPLGSACTGTSRSPAPAPTGPAAHLLPSTSPRRHPLRVLCGQTRRRCQTKIRVRQRQLVLIHNHGHDRDSNLPPEAADAANHGDTAPSTGHLAATATAAPTIAATASANAEPAAAGTIGSGPQSTSSTRNATR